MIEFSAPGKVVLWGEYAVLEGAPALVMAVNRLARCTVEPRSQDWQCRAEGFRADPERLSKAELSTRDLSLDGVSRVIAAVVQQIPQTPQGADIFLDTSEFFARGTKLGIGSSAAICTAAYAAIATLAEVNFSYERALQIHLQLQGGAGSGLDVAAAYFGGLQRFQDRSTAPWTLPANLHFRFFWTGNPATTTSHIARFYAWERGSSNQELAALSAASNTLFERTTVESLTHYVDCLKALDVAAELAIYDPAHTYLDTLANRHQVVYKPSGAGGGDVGVAFSDDAGRLDSFVSAAAEQRIEMLPLEVAEYGIRATHR